MLTEIKRNKADDIWWASFCLLHFLEIRLDEAQSVYELCMLLLGKVFGTVLFEAVSLEQFVRESVFNIVWEELEEDINSVGTIWKIQ